MALAGGADRGRRAGRARGDDHARILARTVVPRGRSAEAAQPRARVEPTGDHTAATLGEPPQRKRLPAREVLRVEQHDRAVARERGVGRALAQHAHVMPGATRQLRPGGDPLG